MSRDIETYQALEKDQHTRYAMTVKDVMDVLSRFPSDSHVRIDMYSYDHYLTAAFHSDEVATDANAVGELAGAHACDVPPDDTRGHLTCQEPHLAVIVLSKWD
jgi:hypothetical protein